MDYSKLIPELFLWHDADGKRIDVGSWINTIGSYEHAIAYGSLFWPELVEHDDCIFRRDVYKLASYQAWFESTRGNKTAIEKVMNHEHLGDLFPNSSTRTMPQINYLARLLKETWECKLQRDFPGIATVVELYDCAVGKEDWADCQITFFRRR